MSAERRRRVLITGATGFLGGYAVREFLAAGDTVLASGRTPEALARRDLDLVATLDTLDEPLDRLNRGLFTRLVQLAAEDEEHLDWAMRMVLVARFFERLGDHAVDIGAQRVFPHTEVDEAYGGRGLATILIGEALARTKADGLRIVPICPTVVAYVQKHPEYADVVDKPTREIIAKLKR